MYANYIKRTFDTVAAIVLLVLASIPFLIIALVIRSDGGPAFFRQQRTGRGGVPFTLYKFRSMVAHNDAPTAQPKTSQPSLGRYCAHCRWMNCLSSLISSRAICRLSVRAPLDGRIPQSHEQPATPTHQCPSRHHRPSASPWPQQSNYSRKNRLRPRICREDILHHRHPRRPANHQSPLRQKIQRRQPGEIWHP